MAGDTPHLAVRLRGLEKGFGSVRVLRGVDLDVPRGGITVVIGMSGAGKSVMLKLIMGLMRPDSGSIEVDGQDITKIGGSELRQLRRRFGYVFQDGALFDSMSVGENVAFPLVHHAPDLRPRERRERVEQTLELVGLPGFYARETSELSGGQRKRVGLARAIVMKPEVVLFDEPTSGLDPITSEAIDDLILEMKERLGVTFVIISHDIVGTVKVADHIAMLYGGQIVAWAPTHAFIRSREPLVRRFLRRNLALPDDRDYEGALVRLRSFG